jgi:hypothetical protein
VSVRFARRAGWELGANPLAERLEAARASAGAVDLTESNPTRCGFAACERLARATLARVAADPRAARYEPSPRGRREAREAVAGYYAARGASVDPEHVVLSAGTSEAYAHLFRLLADPGDAVLVPRPSYPLFDLLAGLEGVEPLAYPLVPASGVAGAWRVDRGALEAALSPRVRAILIVHPNNPTGSFVDPADAAWLDALAAERGLALAYDEVFLDYPEPGARELARSALARSGAALVFALSGVSKVVGLPQAKLGWIACVGAPAQRDEALARLDVISDTYLSIPEAGQLSLPHLLAGADEAQAEIRARVAANRAALASVLPARVLPAQGGWYALVRLDAGADEDEVVERLLGAGVITQPGWFYGLAEPHLVLSLLLPAGAFARGAARLVDALRRPA